MREQIFRGQRCDNGVWVYGYLVKKHDPLLGVAYSFILVQEMDHSCITGEPTILRSEMTWFKVDLKSVGEFSGLTDKNGTRIFEGDIVDILSECEELGVIAYEDGAFIVNASGFSLDFISNIDGKDVEVIGNIHDNSELIGERKDNG